MKSWFAGALLLALTMSLGCDGAQPTPATSTAVAGSSSTNDNPAVGIVRLDAIQFHMGIPQQKKEKALALEGELRQLNSQLQDEISKALEEYGGDVTKLTEEQSKQLRQLDSKRRKQLADKKGEVQRDFQRLSQMLNKHFKAKVEKPVKMIAQRRGLDVVLIADRGGTIAFARTEIDITAEVMKEMGIEPKVNQPPSATPPPAASGAIDNLNQSPAGEPTSPGVDPPQQNGVGSGGEASLDE